MSSHEQIFSAISDAICAYRREPELTSDLNAARDDLDFAKMEIEELKAQLESARKWNREQADTIQSMASDRDSMKAEIADLRDRNSMLEAQLIDANAANVNHQLARNEASQLIQLLEADKAALNSKLDESAAYGRRLGEMLKGFRSAIADAVAEPEVSADRPFLVSDTMGLSASASPAVDASVTQPPMVDGSGPLDVAETARPVSDLTDGEEVFRGWATAPCPRQHDFEIKEPEETRIVDWY